MRRRLVRVGDFGVPWTREGGRHGPRQQRQGRKGRQGRWGQQQRRQWRQQQPQQSQAGDSHNPSREEPATAVGEMTSSAQEAGERASVRKVAWEGYETRT